MVIEKEANEAHLQRAAAAARKIFQIFISKKQKKKIYKIFPHFQQRLKKDHVPRRCECYCQIQSASQVLMKITEKIYDILRT